MTPHERKIKKLQQRRYRAKHIKHEAQKSFKRAQQHMNVFLWLLYPHIHKIAYNSNVPICDKKTFSLEIDKPEFKKCFIEWRKAGNPDHLRPWLNTIKFKKGFVPDNMTWAPIDPFMKENIAGNKMLEEMQIQQDIDQRALRELNKPKETALREQIKHRSVLK